MPKITASFVLYKSADEDIQSMLAFIQSAGELVYFFIIDNSPGKELEKYFDGYSNVCYIFNDANVGYGSGHNVAFTRSLELKAQYHIVINPDIVCSKEVVSALEKYMDANEAVGLVMPKILYPDGSTQFLCKLLPTPLDLFARRFLPARLVSNRLQQFELHNSGYNKVMEVPFLSGCFMFIRLEAIQKTGMFDERFFMYGEDIDLCRRIGEHYKTMFHPGQSVIHRHEAASYKNYRMMWIHIVNVSRYFNKWGWFFDKKRTITNRKTLQEINELKFKSTYAAGR